MSRTDRQLMKKTSAAVCLATLALVAAACGSRRPAGEPAATTAAGDLRWRVWLDPNPPAEKGNVLWIEILAVTEEEVATVFGRRARVFPLMASAPVPSAPSTIWRINGHLRRSSASISGVYQR